MFALVHMPLNSHQRSSFLQYMVNNPETHKSLKFKEREDVSVQSSVGHVQHILLLRSRRGGRKTVRARGGS